ncbi:ImmA/IrrE family metallo-endopeptidase [Catenuloplanes atrovinosus]|uniref:Zn-dependent peptidase ImmA (M78 family) n=1 Tax=Catenuloplanes atrovinosus TaxID=137266 RepID=A0AAE4CD39_9ACTN|nr:ImmA/IrrE family metallo-endopeptidase [Catenuloplanes atrovinosus]MDR7279808.1 Zn-dependent peptidase ImmA (M78 family) [Catenuloplanes atrovinosus]
MTSRNTIELTVDSFLHERGIAEPPIDIEQLCKAEGIAIAKHDFSGNESGFALSQGDTKIIGVNTATTPLRQRFTIAHEFGHLYLHHKPLIVDHSILVISKRNDVSSMGTDQEEVEANAFAAAILMPRNLVRRELEKHIDESGPTDRESVIRAMARTFNVSPQAMGYRLVNLNLITGSI